MTTPSMLKQTTKNILKTYKSSLSLSSTTCQSKCASTKIVSQKTKSFLVHMHCSQSMLLREVSIALSQSLSNLEVLLCAKIRIQIRIRQVLKHNKEELFNFSFLLSLSHRLALSRLRYQHLIAKSNSHCAKTSQLCQVFAFQMPMPLITYKLTESSLPIVQ